MACLSYLLLGLTSPPGSLRKYITSHPIPIPIFHSHILKNPTICLPPSAPGPSGWVTPSIPRKLTFSQKAPGCRTPRVSPCPTQSLEFTSSVEPLRSCSFV